jgi:hypothetical protein
VLQSVWVSKEHKVLLPEQMPVMASSVHRFAGHLPKLVYMVLQSYEGVPVHVPAVEEHPGQLLVPQRPAEPHDVHVEYDGDPVQLPVPDGVHPSHWQLLKLPHSEHVE